MAALPDQSMDEILASIRRVIAQDTPPAAPVKAEEPLELTSVLKISEPPPAAEALRPAAPPIAAPPPPTATMQGKAADPFAALSALIVKGEAPDNTLEGLVRELLRPMLKEWLDAKLPGIVDAAVAREIARLTGR